MLSVGGLLLPQSRRIDVTTVCRGLRSGSKEPSGCSRSPTQLMVKQLQLQPNIKRSPRTITFHVVSLSLFKLIHDLSLLLLWRQFNNALGVNRWHSNPDLQSSQYQGFQFIFHRNCVLSSSASLFFLCSENVGRPFHLLVTSHCLGSGAHLNHLGAPLNHLVALTKCSITITITTNESNKTERVSQDDKCAKTKTF